MYLLILLLALPAIGVIIHSGIRERQEALMDASDGAEKLANSIASEVRLLVDNTHQLSLALSHLPDVYSRNATALNPILKEIQSHYPYYTFIFVTDKDGMVWASSQPNPKRHSLADRRYFKDAVSTGKFSAGEYAIGRVSGLPTMSFGYPFKDKNGAIGGVIGISLNLKAAEHLLVRTKLPVGASCGIFDHKGVFLFRSMDADRFVGKQDRPDLLERMQAGPDEGQFDARTNDSVYRRVAYRTLRLANDQTPYMYIRAGIPRESATRAANGALLGDLEMFAPFLLSACALGWFVSRRCVVDRVHALQAAGRCLAAGDLGARVAGRVRGGELGELAQTFDSMAVALQLHEKELREKSELLHAVIEGTSDAIFVKDRQGCYLLFNSGAAAMTGMSAAEIIGKDDTCLFPQDVAEMLREKDRALMEDGQAVVCEEVITDVTGKTCTVFVTKGPIRDERGNIAGMFGIARDITRRKEAEQELQRAHAELEHRVEMRTIELASTVRSLKKQITDRKKVEQALSESERVLRTLINTNPESILLIDTEGTVLVINETCARRLNKSVAEVVGKNILSFLPPDIRATRKTYVEEVIASRRPVRFEDTRGDRHIDHYVHPIMDGKGDVRQLAILGIDLTDRKLTEEALKRETAQRVQALERLREKERIMIQQSRQAAMGEMISNIAHQWRQPLNTLGMLVQRLKIFHDMGDFSKELLDTSTRDAMTLIRHMSGTIEDFSNFFKPDKEMVTFKVNETIRQAMCLVNASFKHQQIEMSADAEGDPEIMGYPNEYSQALLNILMNARDAFVERAVEDARIRLRIFVENNAVVVTIVDNAGGIPADIVDKIFDPHFTTKGPQGTGIGLFMAKNIIEKTMNGRLLVRNTGEGAEFRIEVDPPT